MDSAVAPDAVCGIDIGTSAAKAILLSLDGRVLAEAEAPYDTDHPRDGWTQIEPALWLSAVEQTLAILAAKCGARVRAIAVAGQMHAAVLLNESGRVVRPAILWTDRRAADTLAPWYGLPPAARARLANPIAAGMTGPILTWLARNDPQALADGVTAVLPKDVVRTWLVAPLEPSAPFTDRSDAAGTLLWDVTRDAWAFDIAQTLGLPTGLLPAIAPSAAIAGTTTKLRRWFPLSDAEVPVIVGAGDTPAARLAVGSPPIQVNMGTGAQVIVGLRRACPTTDPGVHTLADTGFGADAGWFAMAAIQNAGLALDWARRVLCLGWHQVFAMAQEVPDGARGVRFLPFLTGERGGIAGPGAHGAWVGMSETTGRAELIRAAVEALVFTVRAGVDLIGMRDGSDIPTGASVMLTGGGGRHPLVRRLLGDVLMRDIRYANLRSATAIGAAMLAARGIGVRIVPTRLGDIITTPTKRALVVDDAYHAWCLVSGQLSS